MSGDGPFSMRIKAWRGFFGPKNEKPEVKKEVHLKISPDEIIQNDNQTSMLTLTKENSTIVPSWDSSVVYKDKKRLEEYTSDGYTAYNKSWCQTTPYSHCEEANHEVTKLWTPVDSEEKNIGFENKKILILDPPDINHSQSNMPECSIDENILKKTVKERINKFDKSPGLYINDSKDVFFMKVSY